MLSRGVGLGVTKGRGLGPWHKKRPKTGYRLLWSVLYLESGRGPLKPCLVPPYSSQTCSKVPAGPVLSSGDIVRNKKHPKWTQHTTWPKRILLGLQVYMNLLLLLYFCFTLFCLLLDPNYHSMFLPVPVQLTWLQPQDLLCTWASHSHLGWPCLGLPTGSRSWTQAFRLQPLLLPAPPSVIIWGSDSQPF